MPDQLRDHNTTNNNPQPPTLDSAAPPADNCQPTQDTMPSLANPQPLAPNPSVPSVPPGSTGPRTEDGKAKSSLNALKHGLSITRHVVLPHEDRARFEALRVELREIFAPQSLRERLAVEDIAKCKWALRRFEKAEAFALAFPAETHSPNQPQVPPDHKLDYIAVLSDQPGKAHSAFIGIHNLLRYRGHWDRRHQRALSEFDTAQRSRFALLRETRAEAAEQRKQQAELRKQQDHQRKQERHELECELLRARISRERKPAPTPIQQPSKTPSRRPSRETASPVHFVSSPKAARATKTTREGSGM